MASKFKINVCLLLVVIMVGCTPVRNQVTPIQDVRPTRPLATVSPTTTLSIAPQKTSMQQNVSSTPSSISTTGPIPTKTLEPQDIIPICSGNGVSRNPPVDFNLPGAIIYQLDDQDLYIIGGSPLLQSRLPISGKYGIVALGLSPDRRWLAYAPVMYQSTVERKLENNTMKITGTVVLETPTIMLLSAEGEIVEHNLVLEGLDYEVNQNQRWPSEALQTVVGYPTSHWVNNNLLHIELFYNDSQDPYSQGFSPVKFNDPFKGYWLDEPIDQLERFYDTDVELSPDVSRVLYDAKSGGIILRDLAQGKDIWYDREFINPNGEDIQWSPDSKMAVVANILSKPEERRLLIISRDGEVTQIVDATYPLPEFIVYGLSWSPDSRYLAFVDRYDDVNLYIYDTQTNTYLYHCPLPELTQGYPNMVWSPDGKWIAFGDEPDGTLQLLNVQSGEIIKLLENARLIGWSDQFPIQWP